MNRLVHFDDTTNTSQRHGLVNISERTVYQNHRFWNKGINRCTKRDSINSYQQRK